VTITFLPDRASGARVTARELTIDQICISPHNVRDHLRKIHRPDLLASIPAHGLMQPLNVHLMRGSKGKWGTFAGRSRFETIGQLIAAGTLPADWPIRTLDYVGYTDAQLTEMSIIENVGRNDLDDYELFAGVRRANKLGDDVGTIANNLGRDPREVTRWLRMGELAEPVFAAFREGVLTLQQAQAFAATGDQVLQAQVFAELKDRPAHERDARAIRKAMKVGDDELGRLLALVGPDAYRQAGGRYELDLYADDEDQRGIVTDEGLLRQLADQRLQAEKEKLRAASEAPDLRFIAKRPDNGYGGVDYMLEFKPKDEAGRIQLPRGVVAHIAIAADGATSISYWWENRAAKHGQTRAAAPRSSRPAGAAIDDRASPGATREANQAIKEEEGLGTETVEASRSMRRALLRAAIVDAVEDGEAIGRDFFIWSQIRIALDIGRPPSLMGVTPLAPFEAGPEGGRPFVAAMPASTRWALALSRLQQRPFLQLDDPVEAFRSYLTEAEDVKDLAGAVLAGLTLRRSLNAPGYDLPVHTLLGQLLDLHRDERVRRYWTPTPELLDRIPMDQRRAIAEPCVESAAFAGWSRMKSAELTRSVLSVVTGTAAWLRDATRAQATSWVHPLLRFAAPVPEQIDIEDAIALREAAE
jgi:ParB family chromosome partitioning protein